MHLEVGEAYRLRVRSDAADQDAEIIDRAVYQGEIEFWFPTNRASSITAAVPWFIDRENGRVIAIRHEDILEAEML